jgi:hypothetical protein
MMKRRRRKNGSDDVALAFLHVLGLGWMISHNRILINSFSFSISFPKPFFGSTGQPLAHV